ncbi:hypothetical protein [Suttonella ornithocola]|nr:hypothetical protein [Suttonella ornithocola]
MATALTAYSSILCGYVTLLMVFDYIFLLARLLLMAIEFST